MDFLGADEVAAWHGACPEHGPNGNVDDVLL